MSGKTLRREKLPYHLYLIVLFLCMFVLSCLTPLLSDDYTYCYSWVDMHRVTKLTEVVPSMLIHRIHANGRLVPHGFVQAMMIYPKLLFNVLNAGNAVLLAVLFRRYFGDMKAGQAVLLLLIGAMIIWNFSPGFGDSFLWLDGAANYAWGMSALLLFLWPYAADYLGIPRKKSLLRTVGFCVICLAAGDWSESGSLATLFVAGVLFLLILIRDRRVPLQLPAGLLLFALGWIYLMTAPATATKSVGLSASELARNLVNIIGTARRCLLYLYLLYAVLLAAGIYFGADRRKLVLSALLILAGLIYLIPFVFAVYMSYRHYCYPVVTAALACLLPLSELMDRPKRLLVFLCTAALTVPFLFNAAAGSVDIVVCYSKSLEREAAIREALDAGSEIAVMEQHICSTSYGTTFFLVDDPYGWPNQNIAHYYGLNGIALKNPEG